MLTKANFAVLTLGLFAAMSGMALAHKIPLGDGKISTSAKPGYLLSWQISFRKSGEGAQAFESAH